MRLRNGYETDCSTCIGLNKQCPDCLRAYKSAWAKKKYQEDEAHRDLHKEKVARYREQNAERDVYAEGGTRTCSVCKLDLNVTCFHKMNCSKGGLNPQCYLCRWNSNHHKRFPAISITWDQYNAWMDKHGGCCMICRLPEKIDRVGRLSIDHDDNTGIIRGLLCTDCNTSIGKLYHDIELVIRALQYLLLDGDI